MPDSLPPGFLDGKTAVRPVTAADLPWLMSLAYKRYGPYDPGKILTYLLNAMQNQTALFLRTDEAFMLACTFEPIWGGTHECHVLALCAAEGKHWQAVCLLRRSVEWARAKRCRKWWFGSETESRIDALAKRVGATINCPRYHILLGEE